MYVSPDEYRVTKLETIYVTETPEGEVCGLWIPWPAAVDHTLLRLTLKGLNDKERDRIPVRLQEAIENRDCRIIGQVNHDDRRGDVVIAGTDEIRLSPLQAKLMQGGDLVPEDVAMISTLLFAGGPVVEKLWTALERASGAVRAQSEFARIASRKLDLPDDLRLLTGWLSAPEYRHKEELHERILVALAECAAKEELVEEILEVMKGREGARLRPGDVAAILGETGDPRAIPLLMRNRDPSTLAAVARIGGPDAVRSLTDHLVLHSRYEEACWSSLARLGPEARESVLAVYRQDRSFRMRADTAKLVGLCGASARPDLLQALADPQRRVRTNAVTGLIALGDGLLIDEALRLFDSASDRVRPEILRLLVARGGVEVVAFLAAHLERARPPLSWALIDALVAIGHRDAIAALERHCLSRDQGVRKRLAKALVRRGSPEGRRLLRKLLGDESAAVRAAAVVSLSKLVDLRDPTHAEAARELLVRIIDAAPEVAWTVARILPRLGSTATVIEFLESVSPSVSARVLDAVKNLARQAEAGGKAKPPTSPAFDELDRHTDSLLSMPTNVSRPPVVASAGMALASPGSSRPPLSARRDENSDPVHFTVNAPSQLQPGTRPIIDVWAHLSEERASVLEQLQRAFGEEVSVHSKGPVPVARGSLLEVELEIADFDITTPRETLAWSGSAGNCQFVIDVPEDAKQGDHVGTVSIHLTGLLLTRVHFVLNIGVEEAPTADVTAWEERPQSVFASYSSKDRSRVLGRIQGMQKILPELDVFFDVASLRSGDDWKARIATEIEGRDRLYLFWSRAAKASEWVDFEWRHALETKGRKAIDPVPLERPEVAAPPAELADKHFGDWVLGFTEDEAGGDDGEGRGESEAGE